MDPSKRQALKLIEASVHRLAVTARGEQLLCVARDYIDAGELAEARRVLGLVDAAYYETSPPPTEAAYVEALARVIEVFGLDLVWFARPAEKA